MSFYKKITALFPEILTLPVGQGILLRLVDSFELHANLRHRSEDEEVILGFYHTGENTFEELASYEVTLNHPARTARASAIRQKEKQSLRSRFAEIAGLSVQSKTLITRSGSAPINEQLYQAILEIVPHLGRAESGRFLKKESVLQEGFDTYVLCNNPAEAVLEICPIGIDGLSTMTVALDKERKMAGVVEINGAAGRYPFYLPYPEGKEMHPAELEVFSRMLYDRLQNKNREITTAPPCPANDIL